MFMAVKTITVTEDAYETIKRMKSDEESFSELFLRLGHKQLSVRDMLGILKESPEEGAAFAERVRRIRQGTDESSERRVKDVRSRLKRNN